MISGAVTSVMGTRILEVRVAARIYTGMVWAWALDVLPDTTAGWPLSHQWLGRYDAKTTQLEDQLEQALYGDR